MSVAPLTLVQGVQLPASVTPQYTCPTNSKVVIRHVTFTNTDTGSRTVTAHLVPAGGSVSASTMVMDAQSIAASATYVSPELSGIVMNAGDTLQMFADTAAKVSVNASGIQQT